MTTQPCCYEKQLPSSKLTAAAAKAILINPMNAPLGHSSSDPVTEEIALQTSKQWSTPIRLRVSFIDNPKPADDLRARILSHLSAWGEFCDVQFTEDSNNPQVRISLEGTGYWSYVGTDVLLISSDEPTMNLHGFSMATSESQYHRVVRHEAGHTLGFKHEHLRSEIVNWIDEQKAIDYYANPPNNWSEAKTRSNVLTPLNSADLTASSTADVHSIMCYHLPKSILKDNAPDIPGGTDFTSIDKDTAASIYPKQPPVVINQSLDTIQIAVDGSKVYKLHKNGSIWSYNASSAKWDLLDENPRSREIVADGNNLYQRHNNGQILSYHGKPKDWKRLDGNPSGIQIAASKGELYQLHKNGEIWKYTGKPGDWTNLDKNPANINIVSNNGRLYLLHNNGQVFQYTGTARDWKRLNIQKHTIRIAASHDNVYLLRDTGEVFVYTGTPGNWKNISGSSKTLEIVADDHRLFRRDGDGRIYSNATNTSEGWILFHTNKNISKLAAGGGKLLQLSTDGSLTLF